MTGEEVLSARHLTGLQFLSSPLAQGTWIFEATAGLGIHVFVVSASEAGTVGPTLSGAVHVGGRYGNFEALARVDGETAYFVNAWDVMLSLGYRFAAGR